MQVQFGAVPNREQIAQIKNLAGVHAAKVTPDNSTYLQGQELLKVAGGDTAEYNRISNGSDDTFALMQFPLRLLASLFSKATRTKARSFQNVEVNVVTDGKSVLLHRSRKTDA